MHLRHNCGTAAARRSTVSETFHKVMKPLKCYALAVWCLWNGHTPVPGTRYSIVHGRRVECICCQHCHKVL
jgi:hypothetical protein